MEVELVVPIAISIVAIVVTIIIAIRRSGSTNKQIVLLEQQAQNQDRELEVLHQLVESFNRLVGSYDTELASMRQQIQLSSPGANAQAEDPAVQLELEKQKAEKKKQKEEAKLIKKYMKSLEKAEKG